tara:strand:- start:137 stop:805 length:669 start_codon:yes stop_codon:yes gene_type:complete
MAAREGKCQICGELKTLTRDHLPQQALYPKTIRHFVKNFNVVQACVECNNSAKVVDELLKVFVGLVGDAPWKEELNKSVDSTINKNARIARMIEDNSRVEDLKAKDGATVKGRVLKWPKGKTDDLIQAFERIVKGLYFQRFGEVLVETHELSVFYPNVIHPDLYKELDDALMAGDWQSINQGTVNYCFVHINHGDTVCVINLYENIEFCFCIRPKNWRNRSE